MCTNQEHYEQIEKVYALGKVNNISLSGKEVSEILGEKDFLYQHFVEDDVPQLIDTRLHLHRIITLRQYAGSLNALRKPTMEVNRK